MDEQSCKQKLRLLASQASNMFERRWEVSMSSYLRYLGLKFSVRDNPYIWYDEIIDNIAEWIDSPRWAIDYKSSLEDYASVSKSDCGISYFCPDAMSDKLVYRVDREWKSIIIANVGLFMDGGDYETAKLFMLELNPLLKVLPYCNGRDILWQK